MADRYEEKARELHTPQMLRIAVAVATGDAEAVTDACVEINRVTAAALREQDAWWPIDDEEHPAPRDGTPIMVYLDYGDDRPVVGWQIGTLVSDMRGFDLRVSDTVSWHRKGFVAWRPLPAPPPDTGSAQIPSHETGGGER